MEQVSRSGKPFCFTQSETVCGVDGPDPFARLRDVVKRQPRGGGARAVFPTDVLLSDF